MPIREHDVKTVTTAGFPERLVDAAIEPVAGKLVVTALAANTESIYVGGYDTLASAGKGQKLNVNTGDIGDEFVFLRQQPYDIWIDSTANGDGVHWAMIDD